VHVNLDTLKTRRKEAVLLRECFDDHKPFVVDNTNPTRELRQRYIEPAKSAGWRVLGYYFAIDIDVALKRNAKRTGRQRVPDGVIRAIHDSLELPALDEGFDRMAGTLATASPAK
jgi:predicted ABC-type ATPase